MATKNVQNLGKNYLEKAPDIFKGTHGFPGNLPDENRGFSGRASCTKMCKFWEKCVKKSELFFSIFSHRNLLNPVDFYEKWVIKNMEIFEKNSTFFWRKICPILTKF